MLAKESIKSNSKRNDSHSGTKAVHMQMLNNVSIKNQIDSKTEDIYKKIKKLTPGQKAQLVNIIIKFDKCLGQESRIHEEFITLKVKEKDPVTIIGPPTDFFVYLFLLLNSAIVINLVFINYLSATQKSSQLNQINEMNHFMKFFIIILPQVTDYGNIIIFLKKNLIIFLILKKVIKGG